MIRHNTTTTTASCNQPSFTRERRDPDFTYVYLCSAAHSGSTLLACLAAAHPEISCVGEFGASFGSSLRCSCGVVVRECPLWSRWRRRAAEAGLTLTPGNLDVDLAPQADSALFATLFYYQSPWKAVDKVRNYLYSANSSQSFEAEKAVAKSLRLARILCDIEGTKAFFDTTKNPYQPRFLAQHSDVNLKVVALVRDARGVMSSMMKHYGQTSQEARDAWVWPNRNAERTISRYLSPNQVFRLRLEDLCRDPERVCAALFRFMGVADDVSLDCSDPRKRHVIGNKMRYSFTGEIRCDESWRSRLTAKHLACLRGRAARMNRHLGYR